MTQKRKHENSQTSFLVLEEIIVVVASQLDLEWSQPYTQVDDIKEWWRAIYKLSIKECKRKFSAPQKVVSILGDEEKRALYDQTGCVDDYVSKDANFTTL
ncbi:DnaJ domain [Artemisia annua]|uniref:DnaJ domain n=1 Tax=Artemisia annua TaxID=35608 RepID=A0A2U1QB86_ARTAN|nr:DnaJ domain [Artemisia annua]